MYKGDSMELPPIVERGLRCAGPICFLCMQASSCKTGINIISSKSTGALSLLPFVSLLVNCIIWTLYGILQDDNTIIVPNAIGIPAGLFCTMAYMSKCHSPKSEAPLLLTATVLSLCCSLAFYHGDSQSLGLVGCALAILVMGSPLATMKNVIVTKSTASIPFFTSLFMWLNSLCWTSYGLLITADINVYGPNGIGLLLASTQLLLFIIYGFDTPSKDSEDTNSKSFV